MQEEPLRVSRFAFPIRWGEITDGIAAPSESRDPLMASFVERQRCPACGSGSTTTLLSRDFAHPTVWAYLEDRYAGRVTRRELAGRHHEVARCALCKALFQRYVLSDACLATLYDEWLLSSELSADAIDGELLGTLPAADEAGCVLDLGAGDGLFCNAAREAGCDVVAVDLAPSQLAGLRDLGFTAYPRIDDVPRRDIRLARCRDILEHLPHPIETLRAIAERLAPGGRIELSVPNIARCPTAPPRPFWTACDDALRPLEHVNGFTARAVQSMASQLGLFCEQTSQPRWTRSSAGRASTLRWELERPAERGLAA